MPRWFLPLALMAFTNLPVHAQKLQGGFIQVQNDKNGTWTDARWKTELDKMKKAGMDFLIVQYVENVNPKGEFSSILPENNPGQDPLRLILKYGQANNMDIMVGLRYNDFLLQESTLQDPKKLRKLVET